MFTQIRYVTELNGIPKPLIWLSLQHDGSISLGFTDRTFIVPRFKARNFLFNFYNRQTLTYVMQNDREALEPVNNPHFTFHPPIYFHLRANKDDTLFEGIADIDLILGQGEGFPWVRFISGPVAELASLADLRTGEQIEIHKIAITSTNCSIGLGIDFVPPQATNTTRAMLHDEIIEWQGRHIRIFAEELPVQPSTLAWMHQH